MSFNISKKLKTSVSYPEIFLEVENGFATVEITYHVIALESMVGNTVTVWYSRTVDGVTSALKQPFSFEYSGSGNPVEEAEIYLEEYMSKEGNF